MKTKNDDDFQTPRSTIQVLIFDHIQYVWIMGRLYITKVQSTKVKDSHNQSKILA